METIEHAKERSTWSQTPRFRAGFKTAPKGRRGLFWTAPIGCFGQPTWRVSMQPLSRSIGVCKVYKRRLHDESLGIWMLKQVGAIFFPFYVID